MALIKTYISERIAIAIKNTICKLTFTEFKSLQLRYSYDVGANGEYASDGITVQ